jgi:hypothetical protein
MCIEFGGLLDLYAYIQPAYTQRDAATHTAFEPLAVVMAYRMQL